MQAVYFHFHLGLACLHRLYELGRRLALPSASFSLVVSVSVRNPHVSSEKSACAGMTLSSVDLTPEERIQKMLEPCSGQKCEGEKQILAEYLAGRSST